MTRSPTRNRVTSGPTLLDVSGRIGDRDERPGEFVGQVFPIDDGLVPIVQRGRMDTDE